MLKCILTNVHGFLGEFADRLAILGHRLIPVGLMRLLFFCCSVHDSPQLNLRHVYLLYHQVGGFQVLYRQVDKVLFLNHLLPLATFFNFREVEGLPLLALHSSVQCGFQVNRGDVPANLFQSFVVRPKPQRSSFAFD